MQLLFWQVEKIEERLQEKIKILGSKLFQKTLHPISRFGKCAVRFARCYKINPTLNPCPNHMFNILEQTHCL
jgi:hypothetical protein